MIFAAGLGTRLAPITDNMPKALVPVGGVPLLELLIQRLKAAGITDIVINVHHFAAQIVRFIAQNNSFGVNISFSDESNLLLETGGGIRHAIPLLKPKPGANDERFLIHNVDILSNLDLQQFYTEADPKAEAVLVVSRRQTTRYLLFSHENRLVGWTNTATGELRSPYPNLNPLDCRRYAFAGIHLMSTSLFPLMFDWPDRFSIIDFYLNICADHPIVCYPQSNLQLLDVGKVEALQEAERFLSTISPL
jgi:NDP-sugar pyrophosphorylase family protein